MNTRSNAVPVRDGVTAGSRVLPLLVLLPLLPLLAQGLLVALQRASAASAQAAVSARPVDDADLPTAAVEARRRSLEACRGLAPDGTALIGSVSGGGIGDGPQTCWAVEVRDGRSGRPVARLLWQATDGRFMHLARPEWDGAQPDGMPLADARAARSRTLDWLRRLGAAEKGDTWKDAAPATRSGHTFIVRLVAADGRKATAYLDAGSGLPSVVSLIPPRGAAERARNRPE